MAKISFKIAVSVIVSGFFIVTAFAALFYNSLDINFYIVFSAVTIYIFLFGFFIGQNFTSPIKKILQKANEVAGGNLSSRAYLSTKDELEELARIFNNLASRLEEDRAMIQTTEKGVDIKVRAKTAALEETINALDQKTRNRTMELEKAMGLLQKLQEEAKNKEVKIVELRKEIDAFGSRHRFNTKVKFQDSK